MLCIQMLQNAVIKYLLYLNHSHLPIYLSRDKNKWHISINHACVLSSYQNGGDPTKRHHNTHIKEYIELLLSDIKREYMFSDGVVN